MRFFEFASDYLNNLNSYLKLCVFNIRQNFEFTRQQFREYQRKLSSREHFRIYSNSHVSLFSVALNFQTGGEEMQLLHGRFLDNGNSGYVLKPKCLQSGNVKLAWMWVKLMLFEHTSAIQPMLTKYEPRHEKTNILCMRKQRRRSASW